MQTCYCCLAPATSREHVPPKCIFPTKSPENDIDYRQNLLTVPSCDLHNQAKTHHDEYLRTVLTMCFSANEAAARHFISTVLRGANDRPGLIRGILSDRQTVYIQKEAETDSFETIATEIDRERIEISLKQVALGLYFDKFGTKYDGAIDVFPFFLADLGEPDGAYNTGMLKIQSTCDHVFRNLPRFGRAQDIFFYQSYFEGDAQGLLHLVFYGGVRACCLFIENP